MAAGVDYVVAAPLPDIGSLEHAGVPPIPHCIAILPGSEASSHGQACLASPAPDRPDDARSAVLCGRSAGAVGSVARVSALAGADSVPEEAGEFRPPSGRLRPAARTPTMPCSADKRHTHNKKVQSPSSAASQAL